MGKRFTCISLFLLVVQVMFEAKPIASIKRNLKTQRSAKQEFIFWRTGMSHRPCPCNICEIKKAHFQYCCKCKKETSCFPGDIHLQLDNNRLVQMKDLRAGNMVLAVKDGRPVFSKVKTFLNRQPNTVAKYRTLITDHGNQVTLSDSHIIFASSSNQSMCMETRFASSINVGDFIFSTTSCSRGLCPERVIQVSFSTKTGIYVPLTDTGTIVVDGISTSCYGSIHHDIAHFTMTLFRWFPWLLSPWQKDGYSPIITSLVSMGKTILPGDLTYSHNEL